MKLPKPDLRLLKTKCKFSCTCKSFSNSNYTCTKKGGTYCGKYRELSSKLQNRNTNPEKQTDEQDIYLLNPDLYNPATAKISNDT